MSGCHCQKPCADCAQPLRVISLGWGTQSFGLAAMSALGALPPVYAAIHADTGHERKATYEFSARWTPWLEAHGVRVVTVRPAAKSAPGVNAWGGVLLPAYTRGGEGQFGRQCTDDWKRAPIRRWLQANRAGRPVQLWIGITLEEASRTKPADVQYIEHAYPFLGLGVDAPGGKPWKRRFVTEWLQANGLEIPPRSACTFCPLQNRHDWLRVMREPSDLAEAVATDLLIRCQRPPDRLYVLKSATPLWKADIAGQPELDLFGAECSGMCGV